MSRFAYLLVGVIAACSYYHTTYLIDAGSGSDGGGSDECTGAVYDPCTDNTQCMSMQCHDYRGANIEVCTVSCTPGDNSTCPIDATGTNGECNSMGNCKPAQANSCTR
ncbi:MAG TPA: hypothetical protein VMJ10_15355 [Kofleriaceae bacterium]|nr:hypothetical protein [Kofleriaceae bacterium]